MRRATSSDLPSKACRRRCIGKERFRKHGGRQRLGRQAELSFSVLSDY